MLQKISESRSSGKKNYLNGKLFIIKIGLLTGLAIILFEVVNLFVIYQHIKLDYYLSIVAVAFLIIGLLISKRDKQPEVPGQSLGHLLTTKEVQIFQLVAEGKTNKEIAGAFFIEVSTVKTHVNNIYSKLSLKNRKEARVKYEQMVKNINGI